MTDKKYTDRENNNSNIPSSPQQKMNFPDDIVDENVPSPSQEIRSVHAQYPQREEPSLVTVQLEPHQIDNIQLAWLQSFYGPPFFAEQNRWKKPGALFSLALCLLAVLVGGAFIIHGWLVGASPPPVTLYRVGSMQSVALPVGGGGIAFPRQTLDILYPVAERVISVMVKAGDHVSPDQPLLQLDSSLLDSAIRQAANDMVAAQNYLNSVSGSGNAVTIAQAQQAYEVAKNKYDALITQASSPLLRDGRLISPINGIVTQVNVNPGEMFEASKPLLTIIDGSTVVVHAKIPLSSLGLVHPGQTVSVTPSALPDLHFNGTISSIIPQADPQTDTFEVWVSVDNKARGAGSMLLPGMSAFVHIQSQATALVVPRLAVLDPDGEAAVYIVRNQVARLQRVQVAGRSVESIFINGGLSPGSQIVLVGLDKLHDNQKVHIIDTE